MSTNRKITTNLLKKLETFRVMALGEAMGSPILLIGPPGVAKTAAVIDYAAAAGAKDDVFLLETDEGTKSNAIKGNINLEELTLNQKYKVDAPITDAEYIVINEIDKASASLRNSLLGIMNEKILFNGIEKIKCKWKAFIATCNSIPDDEVGSPFWDRFLITFKVERLSQSDILNYYAKGGKDFRQDHDIPLPDKSDITNIKLTDKRIKKAIDIIYGKLSDRSLSFFPLLVKNIMIVWKYDEVNALIKSVELLVDKNAAKALSKSLVSKELRAVYDAIDGISQCVSMSAYSEQFDKVQDLAGILHKEGKLKEEEIKNIKIRLTEEESKLEFLKKKQEPADTLA